MSDLEVKVYADESSFIATDPWTQPFWDAGKEGKLVVARCGSCGTFRMPPLPFCAECHSQAIEWMESSGRAELFSYTVCQRKGKADEPGSIYIPAVVEIPDSGNVRLTGNIVDIAPDDVRIGMALEVFWTPIAEGYKFPTFRPVRT